MTDTKQLETQALSIPAQARAIKVVDAATYTERWTFRIINPQLIPRDYLTPNLKMIGGVARAWGRSARIPGVEVYAEKGVSGRG